MPSSDSVALDRAGADDASFRTVIDATPALTVEEWVEAAVGLSEGFPEGRLRIGDELRDRAVTILDAVRAALRESGVNPADYFDHSRPRYEYALALAIDGEPCPTLDVGCSPGHLAMALVRAGFDVHGLDLNDLWRVKYAPGWPDRLHVQVANVEHEPIPAADQSYGLVTFTEVLEHIAVTDPSVVLGEIRRVLRVGGRLILSTPNVANVSNILALARGENIFWPPPIFYGSLDRHNREYTPAEVCAVLERSGFRSYEIGYMNAWSNWHHVTGPLFHHLHGPSGRTAKLTAHPLFNNTVFAVATRTE